MVGKLRLLSSINQYPRSLQSKNKGDSTRKIQTFLAAAFAQAKAVLSPSIGPAAWADDTRKTTTGSPKMKVFTSYRLDTSYLAGLRRGPKSRVRSFASPRSSSGGAVVLASKCPLLASWTPSKCPPKAIISTSSYPVQTAFG